MYIHIVLCCQALITFTLLCCNALVAAAITEAPVNLTTIHPENATFNCSANGLPIPTISWSNGTVSLNQSEDYVIVTMTNEAEDVGSMLTIIAADPFDAATYTCNVTNLVGSDTSSAFLTVHGKYRERCIPGTSFVIHMYFLVLCFLP